MKIIIPMAGIGKRLSPLTQHKPKALVRLADKRLLDHVLSTFEELEKNYTLEYVFIIGYLGEQIKEHMKAAHPEKTVSYFVQEELKGQSHAVLLAKDIISGPILLTYCDTINKIDFSFLESNGIEGVASVLDVDDPSRHGIAVTGPDGFVTRLVEKPKTLEYKSALTGLYYFSEGEDLVKAIEAQIQKGRSLNKEYYLADALNILVENGMRIKSERALQWLDAGTPDDMLETNALLLNSQPASRNQEEIGKSSLLVPPVYIHESANVENCIIGPNVAIGKNCFIGGSILKNTIVDDDSIVTNASLENSLIGRGCSVTGSSAQIMVADYEEKRLSLSTPYALQG
jgi:glucose-1-phosphate thymidylyltransferase